MNNSHQKLLKIFLLIIICIVAFGLPLSIAFEFEERYIFYFQLYPHMILFPLFCFGIIGVNLYQAFSSIRKQKKIIRSRFFVLSISLLISFFLSSIEITSNNIMFFELNATAQSSIDVPRDTIEQIYEIPKTIIDPQKIISEDTLIINKSNLENALINFIDNKEILNNNQKNAYYQLMKTSLSYSAWEDEKQGFSLSRRLYVISFFILVFTSLINWMLLFIYFKKDITNPNQYINNLAISSLLFLMWIPLRFYYNLITKNLIFGSEYAIGQLDVFAFIIYPIYFLFLCWKIFQIRKDKILIIIISTLVFLLTLIGRFKPEWFDLIFGLKSNPLIWIIFLGITIIYFLYLLKITFCASLTR